MLSVTILNRPVNVDTEERQYCQANEEKLQKIKIDLEKSSEIITQFKQEMNANQELLRDCMKQINVRDDIITRATNPEHIGIDKKKRPNVFVAIQLTNPSLLHAMEAVQQDLVESHPSLTEFIVSVKRAHITLLVFRAEEEEMQRAKRVLYKVQEKILDYLCIHEKEDTFDIQFEGVGTFEQVVFAKPISGIEKLTYMNQELLRAFSSTGFSCDTVFTPPCHAAKAEVWQRK